MTPAETALRDEVTRWSDLGHTARLWLRDDDATAATPALEQFAATLAAYRVPALIAAIPAALEASLASLVAANPDWRVAVHGWSHANHAPSGHKKSEYPAPPPPTRTCAEIDRELGAGLAIITRAFAAQALPVLVPPWNRIDPATVARLAGLGYRGLSTFANQHVAANVVPLAVINTHVDLMAWKGARGGRDWEPVARDLTASLQAARAGGLGPVGLLTHHLVHDQVARDTLSRVLDAVAATNAAIWVKPGDVFAAP